MVHLRNIFTTRGTVRVLSRVQYEKLQRQFEDKYGIPLPSYDEYKLKVAKERK